jgi:hypothetical protein
LQLSTGEKEGIIIFKEGIVVGAIKGALEVGTTSVDATQKVVSGAIKGAAEVGGNVTEVAVSSVAKIVGMNDLVPETYVRNDPKHGPCSIQTFVENGKNPDSTSSPYGRSTTDVARAALLDFVVGNQDRHSGNYLVAGGELKLIDNGLSFATKGGYLRSRMIDRASEKNMEIPKEVYETFVSKRGEIETTLRSHKIEEEAISNMGKRYDSLARLMNFQGMGKTFERLKIFHKDDNGWSS